MLFDAAICDLLSFSDVLGDIVISFTRLFLLVFNF